MAPPTLDGWQPPPDLRGRAPGCRQTPPGPRADLGSAGHYLAGPGGRPEALLPWDKDETEPAPARS